MEILFEVYLKADLLPVEEKGESEEAIAYLICGQRYLSQTPRAGSPEHQIIFDTTCRQDGQIKNAKIRSSSCESSSKQQSHATPAVCFMLGQLDY